MTTVDWLICAYFGIGLFAVADALTEADPPQGPVNEVLEAQGHEPMTRKQVRATSVVSALIVMVIWPAAVVLRVVGWWRGRSKP